jgi:ATP-dependent HslUV protease subunit HslV
MIHATTVLAVRHNDKAVMASDGQVTFGNTVVKHAARKIRRLYNDRVLAGFAGSAAKDWRTDRVLRRLEAMLVVMDLKATYLLSGNGDLIEPDDGIIAIGSGGPFAMAAAKALAQHTELDSRTIAEQAMRIAGEICIYTNENITIEAL